MNRTKLLISILLTAASIMLAGSEKLAKDLASGASGGSLDVIVQFTEPPTARHHRKISDRGGVRRQTHSLIKGGLDSVPPNREVNGALEIATPKVSYDSVTRGVKINTGTSLVGSDHGICGAGLASGEATSIAIDGEN